MLPVFSRTSRHVCVIYMIILVFLFVMGGTLISAQSDSPTSTAVPTATPFNFDFPLPDRQTLFPKSWVMIKSGDFKGYWLPTGSERDKLLADWKNYLDHIAIVPYQLFTISVWTKYTIYSELPALPTQDPAGPTFTPVPANPTYQTTSYGQRVPTIIGCNSQVSCLAQDNWKDPH